MVILFTITNIILYSYSNNYLRGALAAPSPKDQTNQKNPEKHPEDPPGMHASQGRHASNDGGTQSRATARTTPNNGHNKEGGRIPHYKAERPLLKRRLISKIIGE